MKQKQEVRERWRGLIAEQSSSGEPIPSFCRRRDVPEKGFYYWRSRLAKERATVKPQFIALSPGGTVESFELELSSGARLRIPPSFDSVALKRLLETLGC